MYAVFRTGGKQYRAAIGDVLRLEKIEAAEGSSIDFEDVLLLGEGNDIEVGNPVVTGSSVSAKVLRQGKSRKVPVVKFKRRQNYLRQATHRQFFTEVEITGISATGGGKAAAPKAAAAEADGEKKVAKKAAASKPAAKKATTRKSSAADQPAAKKKAAKKTAE